MEPLWNYEFIQRAFLAGILMALSAPLVGTFIITRRLSLIADTLSHIALSGVAIGMILGVEPMWPTLGITIAAAIGIEILRSKDKLPGETILAMFLPGGLAISLILLSLGHGINANLFSYLFGSLTTVGWNEVILMAGLTGLVWVVLGVLYKQFLYTAYDEDGAQLVGIKVKWVNVMLICLTAITVAISMRIVGILLVGAMMIIPVMAAGQVARSFKQTLLLGTVMATIGVIAGLLLAYWLNLPTGAAIVVMQLGLFGLTRLVKV